MHYVSLGERAAVLMTLSFLKEEVEFHKNSAVHKKSREDGTW